MLVEKTGLSVLKTDFGVSLSCCGNEGIYNIKANQESVDRFIRDNLSISDGLYTDNYQVERYCFVTGCYNYEYLEEKLHVNNRLRY